jgi:hypothetical protein
LSYDEQGELEMSSDTEANYMCSCANCNEHTSAVDELKKTILIICPDCDGRGDVECAECCGTGEGGHCDACDGDGVIYNDNGIAIDDCVECNGNGYYECEGSDCGSVGIGLIECEKCGGNGEIEAKDA